MNPRAVLVALALPAVIAASAVLSTANAQTRSAPTTAAPQYEIDAVHSTIIFRVKHLGVGYFYGRINDPSGSFTFDAANPDAAALEISVKARNVDTNNTGRDDHIRNIDFFNAKQFPVITFKSTGFTRSGDNMYKVAGNLTFRGMTKPIAIDLEHVGEGDDPWGKYRCGFHTTFSISRRAFGMDYMPQGLGDEIVLMVGLEGIRQ
jgi:polyisoprenoid-binding protein YceI